MDYQFFEPVKNIDRKIDILKSKTSPFFRKKGENMALRLFRFAVENVSAYRSFLLENKINYKEVKNISDFKRLPIMDKSNYLKKFEYKNLFPKESLKYATTISATSGTTGEPFYFPRGEEQDWQYYYIADIFLRNQWDIGNKKTLGIIGFGLGVWIGGIFTYKNFNKIASEVGNFSLVPVGPNIDMYMKVFKKLSGFYDQIILMGYPPFIKDVVDEASNYGVDLKKYKIKILTGAEGYSEKFRDYLAKKSGINNPALDIINIYGTVEMGTMAHETPIANLIRKISINNEILFKKIFPKADRVPTLAQYHPDIIHFEEVNGEVIASGYGSSIPLLRYRFPDMGGVISFDEMVKIFKSSGIDLLDEAKKIKINHTIMRLPFVYVYDRSDNAASLVGIILYPEYIRSGICDENVSKNLTGKFTMITKNNKNQNQYLEVNIELKRKNNLRNHKKLKERIKKSIVESLIKNSTEYNYLYNTDFKRYGKSLIPKIILWPYQHEKHFKPGGKQKWVKK